MMNRELNHRIVLLKHIAPHQSVPEREKMWDDILQILLSWWSRYPQYNYNFSLAFDALVPELSDAQRNRIPREIWETRLTPENHHRLPWKYLPKDLFSLAWDRLKGIREETIPTLIEDFVRYAPDHMISIIEPDVEKLSDNSYSSDCLPRIKAMLIRRNLHLSQNERNDAYLELVHKYIDRYQLTDLLKYIPQELTLQIWVLKLTDYRDFRLNDERRKNYGPYRIEETSYLLIDQMPLEDVSKAIDRLLDEVFRDDTLYNSCLDPKITSELCNALLRCLPKKDKEQKSKAIVERTEIEARHEIESQSEGHYRALNLSLLGYLISFLEPIVQEDHWENYFNLVTSIKSYSGQISRIIGHLERYPTHQRLTKWHEAWQLFKLNNDANDLYGALSYVFEGIPVIFGETYLKDKELARDLANAVLSQKHFFASGNEFSRTWLGLAQIIPLLDRDITQALYVRLTSRNTISPFLACAFMPFLSPEQIDNLLVYDQQRYTNVMYYLNKKFLYPLRHVIAQWSGSTAALVWSRSFDVIEQFISEQPGSYHPDLFMVWLRLIAEAVPNYDVVAAWKHLLDHRDAFWFNAWQDLGAILIENLHPISNEEAIRIIWRDIQEIEENTETLQSAIAPKIPTDIVSTLRTQFTNAPLPPNDVFVCSLPTYIYYGGGPQTNRFFEYNRWWTQQNGKTSSKVSKFTKLLLWFIAIINSLLYPIVYLYMTLSKITKPIHQYVSLGIYVLFFPILLVFIILDQLSYRSRFIISPFRFTLFQKRRIKGLMEPVLEIVKVHQLPKSTSKQRFVDLLNKGDFSDFASARPLLQRIGGKNLRYTAHQAYQGAVKWWANATIDKPQT